MSEIVPSGEIEKIVGAIRHSKYHYGRAVTSEQSVYVLHSQHCLDTKKDLRECQFSKALDNGIDETEWEGLMDEPVLLTCLGGTLFPICSVRLVPGE